jgi:hypothetical protein
MGMKCEAIHEDLQAFLDDALAPEDRQRVADHVAACPSCRATLRDLRAVSGALGRWAVPEPENLPSARELLARAQTAASAPTATHAWPPVGFQKWFAAAALVVIAAGFSLVVFRASRNLDSAATSQPRPSIADVPGEGASATPPPSTPPQTAANVNATAVTNTSGEARPAPATEAKEEKAKGDTAASAEPETVVVTADEQAAEAPAANEAPPPPPAAMAPAQPPAPSPAPGAAAGEAQPEDAPKPMIAEPSAETADAAGPRRQRPRAFVGGRKVVGGEVVKRATIRLGAQDPASVADRVASVAAGAGGSVASRSAKRSDGRDEAIRLTLKVDPDQFEAAVSRIRGLATVRGESSSAKDVSGRIRELDAEIAEGEADASDDRGRSEARKSAPAPSARRERDQLVTQARQATIEVVIESE